MPVTFKAASHLAEVIGAHDDIAADAPGFLAAACYEQAKQCGEFLQSSLEGLDLSSLQASKHGFVGAAIHAYNEHHNLSIRPDDVWIAILSQFNFYVNAHAEELRDRFVPHEGKKPLVVHGSGTRHTADYAGLSQQMADLIHENLVDKSLHEWILPDFTTTTPKDKTICAVTMMATLKNYFTQIFGLRCGISSVKLEGEKSDWESILARLDKIDEFGVEPIEFASMLRPIIQRFISAFDGEPDVDFWSKIAHYSGGGSGPTYLSGWITAFCTWTHEGKRVERSVGKVRRLGHDDEDASFSLGDISYSRINTQRIPPGYCEVDVVLDENGNMFDCLMVAGHVAMENVSSESGRRDTLRPSPHWFIFVKGENPNLAAAENSRRLARYRSKGTMI
ncbi:hypothetical protein BOTBODRAFT_58894 [Botryobasidium botryosum FD-172 SS1]|uniref:DUF4419 domain-containing protein n=1 Tax=Botryobasidium botryosum (strain FD-172 SS1) TaxID=930990 RepID=A0A067M050_BOTB1|nr:hypothetical protein BOTBODRAFT_58894 [Botryobasidium botryosum FD-172 SS1]